MGGGAWFRSGFFWRGGGGAYSLVSFIVRFSSFFQLFVPSAVILTLVLLLLHFFSLSCSFVSVPTPLFSSSLSRVPPLFFFGNTFLMRKTGRHLRCRAILAGEGRSGTEVWANIHRQGSHHRRIFHRHFCSQGDVSCPWCTLERGGGQHTWIICITPWTIYDR